jgi:hypothetical protein
MTPEGKTKAKIKAMLKKYNVYYAMPMGTGFGNSGVPDFLCCINGFFLGIEAKAGKGKTTALQNKNLDSIVTAGGMAIVVNEDSMEYLEAKLKELKERMV